MTTERPLPLRLTQELTDKELFVQNSGIVNFQFVPDRPDGNLTIAETGKHIPFPIERAYWINSLKAREAVRGKHAHKELEQVIVCVNGSFRLHLDDGTTQQDIVMDTPKIGIRLGAMLWHEMTNFSPDCVILVLASAPYKEADYIRSYDEFINTLTEEIKA